MEQRNLRQFAETVMKPLEKIWEEQQEFSPMWFIERPDGELIVASTPWTCEEEKNNLTRAIKEMIKKERATKYIVMHESWTLMGIQEIPESIKSGGSISSHPDRREAITALGEDRNGGGIYIVRYILRPENGPARLSEPKIINFDKSEGTPTNMFTD